MTTRNAVRRRTEVGDRKGRVAQRLSCYLPTITGRCSARRAECPFRVTRIGARVCGMHSWSVTNTASQHSRKETGGLPDVLFRAPHTILASRGFTGPSEKAPVLTVSPIHREHIGRDRRPRTSGWERSGARVGQSGVRTQRGGDTGRRSAELMRAGGDDEARQLPRLSRSGESQMPQAVLRVWV